MSDLLQILKATGVKATVTLYADGVPTDSGTQVKVDVVRPDGTLLVTQANASDEAGTGVYGYQLAPQAEVTLLRLDWSGTVGGVATTVSTYVEVLGALLFTLPAMRAMKVAGGTPFSSTATPKYEDAQIMEARSQILDEMTEILQFSPVPRFRRETFDGNGRTSLILPGLKATRILSVTVNGVAQTASSYQVAEGNQVEAVSNYGYGTAFTSGRRNVTVEWVAGWPRVKGIGGHIAMIWAAAQLNPSGFSSAVSVSTPDGAQYTYEPSEVGRGGFRRPTGIKQADRWFDLHAAGSAAVA